MGDMNAKVGNNNVGNEFIMGKEGLGEMNDNGELFTDFCGQNDLVIGGSIFPHKNIHKSTWTSPDHTVNNQIDHVTISRRWRRTLTDVRAYRSADAGSDHQLVIAKLQVRIARVKKSEQQRQPRFDTTKLRGEEVKNYFKISFENRYQALADLVDGSLEKKWERVRCTFTDTCREELGHRKRTYKTWL
ncbi:craniofacial development protein 2-like [Mercenaria mercenaria]|uniref:craniofacial development protein 2-like n=1 Tax=Mercenaria mercenaria TaxID=6596 RepID=UPI00234EDCB1|nr:craniofacial development protein 2-like [Mercenaria mercenaria]